MALNTNVIQSTNREGICDRLEDIQKQLILCEKALAEYLETKRLFFPRFYFISSADLLDILSIGNEPKLVMKHLTKLFDSIAKLELGMDENNEIASFGMYAKDGEYVPFDMVSSCTGPVEIWLDRIQTRQRSSLRHYMSNAVIAYEEKPREQWVFDYPAQVSLLGTQIYWTNEVNIAFGRLEEGYDNAMKDYYKKQILQLSTLISLLIGELTKGDRQNIMTICTVDVHSRDVVSRLIQAKVESSSAFQVEFYLIFNYTFNANFKLFSGNHSFVIDGVKLRVIALRTFVMHSSFTAMNISDVHLVL